MNEHENLSNESNVNNINDEIQTEKTDTNNMESIFSEKEIKQMTKRKKLAIISSIIGALIIIIVIIIILVTKKDDTKEEVKEEPKNDMEVVLTPEEEMTKYGESIEELVQNYVNENDKIPTPEDLKNKITEFEANITCTEFLIYEDQKIYLSGCSIAGSEELYTYGTKQVDESLGLVEVTDTLYDGYKEAKLTKMKKYNPHVIYEKDNSEIKNFLFMKPVEQTDPGDEETESNNEQSTEEETDIAEGTEISADFTFLNNKIYLSVNGIDYEIEGIEKPKEVVTYETGCIAGEYSIYILTNSGSVYYYDSSFEVASDNKFDLDDAYEVVGEEGVKSASEYIATHFKQVNSKKSYVNLKLASLPTTGSCGASWLVLGETSDDIEYVVDGKDTLLTDYIDYAYMGAENLDVNYFVDLNGVVKTSDNKNQEINLGVKASYIFSDYEGDKYLGDYILGADNKLYQLVPGVEYNKDNILFRNVAITNVHYKKIVKSDYTSYDIIFTFSDKQALVLTDVSMNLKQF